MDSKTQTTMSDHPIVEVTWVVGHHTVPGWVEDSAQLVRDTKARVRESLGYLVRRDNGQLVLAMNVMHPPKGTQFSNTLSIAESLILDVTHLQKTLKAKKVSGTRKPNQKTSEQERKQREVNAETVAGYLRAMKDLDSDTPLDTPKKVGDTDA